VTDDVWSRLGFPTPTPKAGVAAVASFVLVFVGLALFSVFPVVVGLTVAAVLVNSALEVGRVDVDVERVLEKDNASEGEEITVDLEVEGPDAEGVAFEFRDDLSAPFQLNEGSNYGLLELEGGAEETYRYTIQSPIKGTMDVGPTEIRLKDGFDLFVRDEEAAPAADMKIYPRAGELDDVPADARQAFLVTGAYLTGQPGAGTDFFALREYQPGDPMKHVNWKASSKTADEDDLVVNERERESQTLVTLLFDARTASRLGTDGRNANVLGARAVMSLYEFFLDARDRVEIWAYGDELVEIDAGGDRQAHRLRELLVATQGEGDMNLGDVVDEKLAELEPRTPVIIVSNFADDPTVADAVRRIRARDCTVSVVSPGIPDVPEDRLNGSRIEYELAERERELVLDQLRGYGASVVDWRADESLAVAIERVVHV
jgi:uncharacterized protein (DUF58 family)